MAFNLENYMVRLNQLIHAVRLSYCDVGTFVDFVHQATVMSSVHLSSHFASRSYVYVTNLWYIGFCVM